MKKTIKAIVFILLLTGAVALGFSNVVSAREGKIAGPGAKVKKHMVRPYPYFKVRPYVYFYHYPYSYFKNISKRVAVGDYKMVLPTRIELMKKFGLK